MNEIDFADWYNSNKELYIAYTDVITELIKNILKEEKILYHSVSGRVKNRDSFMEKVTRKDYVSQEQMTDFSGIRVITYTTAEIPKVCNIIEQEFDVDIENSCDKSDNLDVNQVGYLSVHYIVRLKNSRIALAEYRPYKDMCCEIQVRSLLQHAWAEIEHDRNYKFSGVLPKELRRRFFLVAGTLELMDKEFQSLTEDIDLYAENIQKQAENGNLDLPIDSTSLVKYLDQYFKEYDIKMLSSNYARGSDMIIQELQDYGIETLQQLNNLLQCKSVSEWVKQRGNGFRTYIGIIRDAMIINNPKLYFSASWKERWGGVKPDSFAYWKENGFDPDSVKDIVKFIPPNDSTGIYWVARA